jgi:hypothetical protein
MPRPAQPPATSRQLNIVGRRNNLILNGVVGVVSTPPLGGSVGDTGHELELRPATHRTRRRAAALHTHTLLWVLSGSCGAFIT